MWVDDKTSNKKDARSNVVYLDLEKHRAIVPRSFPGKVAAKALQKVK